MAVERFRSIEEMNAARVRTGSDDGFERFIRHCARYRSMAPRVRLRGVFKFRSLAEAQGARLSSRSAPVRSDQDAETIG
ncbi:MAG: hypothetical protein OXG04_03210 [Acidobacteria bacterium]|nr:hypothetical protein [Acidobacteriota bacterium]